MTRAFLGSMRLQFTITARSLDDAALLVLLPVYLAVFAVVLPTTDTDMVARVVLGPGLIGLWMMAAFGAGEVMDRERWCGTMGLTLSAPAPLAVLVAGRVAASTLVGVVAVGYVVLLGEVFLPSTFAVASPLAFAIGLALTAFAALATAPILACVSVLARNGDVIRNALTFPMYLVSGVVVPLEMFPAPVQALGKLTFLYWGGELLRGSLHAPALFETGALLALVTLTVSGVLLSALLLARVDRMARSSAQLEVV